MKHARTPLTKKGPPNAVGWTSVVSSGKSACLRCRPHAARAHLDLFGLVAFDHRHRLEIWVETAGTDAMTKAYLIPKRWTFTTFSAFCHIEGPPDF